MENKNMTALISCFSRAYHYKNNKYRIFDDFLAEKILSKEEYDNISLNMTNGMKFFNCNFNGNEEESLKWIVDNILSPSVLARSMYTEKTLNNEIKLGTTQYLIFASGYDTFAYRNSKLLDRIKVFEIDKKDMIKDKIKRLKQANIDYSKVNFVECDFTSNNWINSVKNSKYNELNKSFCSLLGISYYLTKEEFNSMLKEISNILTKGSTLVFDYPIKDESNITIEVLAKGANEEMKSKYSYRDIENILSDSGFLIYENVSGEEMTLNYFDNYNILNPNNKINAPKNVNYCLAVKK